MASSSDLRRLRRQYMTLKNDINSALLTLKKVPEEIDYAGNRVFDSFQVDNMPIDKGKLSDCTSSIENDISNLQNHIYRIENRIDRLTDLILEAELSEEGGING